MNTQERILVSIGTALLLVLGVIAIMNTPSNNSQYPAINTPPIEVMTSYPDTSTSMLEPLFPVPIIRVTKTNMDGMKWEVESENGVIFYTNNKPKVGEVAFYMDNETEKVYWIKK